MNHFQEMLSYSFMQRAFIVGSLVSVCAAVLGTSLVLKRYSMIGDGLSHVGFASLAAAYALNLAPLSLSIPVCIIAAVLLLQLEENAKIKGDAATALMTSGSLAVGVMMISLSRGMNVDINNYMFGSILALKPEDVTLSLLLSLTVLLVYIFFYHRIFAITFDENFAKATGLHGKAYSMVLAILTAVTIVIGMRLMGTLLISSLVVFPSITAMRVCRTFRMTVVTAALLSLLGFLSGLVISYLISAPTGACIVLVDIALFVIFYGIEMLRES